MIQHFSQPTIDCSDTRIGLTSEGWYFLSVDESQAFGPYEDPAAAQVDEVLYRETYDQLFPSPPSTPGPLAPDTDPG